MILCCSCSFQNAASRFVEDLPAAVHATCLLCMASWQHGSCEKPPGSELSMERPLQLTFWSLVNELFSIMAAQLKP